MDIGILELLKENILEILGVVITVLILLQSFASKIEGITSKLKNKVEKQDLDKITNDGSLNHEYLKVHAMIMLNSSVIPEEYKEMYRNILKKDNVVIQTIKENKEKTTKEKLKL